MAQRTGADDLLAPRARQASARAILALAAIAALSLAGCGGGDSSTETASSAVGASQAEAAAQDKAAKEGSAAKGGEGQRQGAGSAANPSGAPGAGKHGEPITPPKGERERQATPAEEANATVVDIALQSPAFNQGGALPPTYTCEGDGTWPPLQWRGVPQGTKELVLFAMNVAPVQGKLFFDWALAGIDPGLEAIESGKLPPGAVQGQNSFGKAAYEICPAPGEAETYVFALYALPTALSPRRGFDPAELRRQVQALSRNAGLLTASYRRG